MIANASSVAQKIRATMLGSMNDLICRRASAKIPNAVLPSFIVVTPQLVHLAPLAAQNHSPRVQPAFVANGIGRSDIQWLARVSPQTPLIHLRASLRRNSASVIEHGMVINHLAKGCRTDFCIQDADCFVTDSAFWNAMQLVAETDFAAGPFLREGEGRGFDFPETFLLYLNRSLLAKYRREYGITAESSSKPRAQAQRLLELAGYPRGIYLETLKDYYDTLQQFWVVARRGGFAFRLVPGNGTSVHHVGGTSYLHRNFEKLDHWDYWPLNVHYFHLKLLEMPRCAPFRERFRALKEFHGSSHELLAAFPAFADGWRRRESDLILERTQASTIYAGD